MNVLSHIMLSKCDRKYQRKEASREYIYIYILYINISKGTTFLSWGLTYK